MSQTEALARALTLKTSLLDHGVRAVSIELQTGRPGTPNDAWWDSRFMSCFVHHTVSRPANGNTPCLALVKSGRVDVPGPLCNGYGGFDEVARIICMGWANHPGYGGPLTLPGGTIPMDNARPYGFGWEFEGGIEPWTESMHAFMARCSAGTLDWLGRGVDSQAEHKTWAPTRKIDRLNYSTASGRARTAAAWNDGNYLPQPPDQGDEDDNMIGFIVTYQGIWLVKPDLTSRTGFSSMADLTAVVNTDRAKYPTIVLSAGQMARIPVAGTSKADLSDEDLKQSAALTAEALVSVLAAKPA